MSKKQTPRGKAVENRVTTLFEGRIVRLYLKEVTLPNGRNASMEVIHHAGAAAVVPLHEDGSVTLIHQYRHAVGGWLYEIPAGLLEPEESPETCAGRELEEEAGLTAGRLVHLSSYHTTPGFTDEVVHLYLATKLTECPQRLEPDEIIERVRMPLAEAMEMIANGRITDGKTITGLLLAEQRV